MIRLGIAVNDHRTGNFSGYLSRLNIVDIIYLEGDPVPCDFDEAARLFSVGDKGEDLRILYKNHGTWVGNICWDSIRVSAEDAAKLINYLRITAFWSPEEAVCELFEKWDREGDFITAQELERYTLDRITCPDCEASIPPDGACWYCENDPGQEDNDNPTHPARCPNGR